MVPYVAKKVVQHYRSFLRAPRKKYLSQKSHGYFDILVRYFSPCVLVLMMEEKAIKAGY